MFGVERLVYITACWIISRTKNQAFGKEILMHWDTMAFSYWFSNDDKPSNIEIYFCDLKKNYLLRISLFLLSFDVLHRQLKSALVNEIIRFQNKTD
jgi:hypothetical protein